MRGSRKFVLLGIVALALIATSLAVLALRSHSRSAPVPTDRPLAVDAPYFQQDDPKWASALMGQSGQTMGEWGCTVTCVAMGLSGVGTPMDPGEVCAALNASGGFTQDGLVIWGAVSTITDGAVGIDAPGLDYGAIDSELAEGRPVIAKIVLPQGIQHWVLVVGRDSADFLAHNPAAGDATPMRLPRNGDDIKAIRLLVLK